KAAELMAQQTRLNLRVEVAQAYAQSAVSRRLVESYDLLRLSLGQTLQQSELKFQVGAATSTDIAQAKARLAEAEAGYARANGNLATSLAQLRSLTGVEVRVEEDLPAPPPTPATRDEAIAMALQNNPQLLAAQQMVVSAEGKR